jgi:general secretion pathway protein M
MKVWWERLNSREKMLVGFMSVMVAIFIFYSAIWQPLNSSLKNSNEKLARQQVLLTWVVENTERFKKAQGSGTQRKGSGSLSAVVNRSANSHQLTITRIQPQGDDLQVWLDSVPFTQLLFWLEHLVNTENLKVKTIDLTRGDTSGEVKVRRLQLGKR